MLCMVVPAEGTNEGVLNANVPGRLATPSFKVDAESAWPSIMIDACGSVVIVGVALAMVKSTVLP